MITIQLSEDGMAFSIEDGQCKAMEKQYETIATGFSKHFQVLIDANKIDLCADIDLQLAHSLMSDFPGMTIDTTKQEPLETDTWNGGRVF
jgi:hypothetical protein